MRLAKHLKVITSQVEILEDLKCQLEGLLEYVINVILEGKLWIEEKGVKLTFIEMNQLLIKETSECLVKCLQIGNENQEDSDIIDSQSGENTKQYMANRDLVPDDQSNIDLNRKMKEMTEFISAQSEELIEMKQRIANQQKMIDDSAEERDELDKKIDLKYEEVMTELNAASNFMSHLQVQNDNLSLALEKNNIYNIKLIKQQDLKAESKIETVDSIEELCKKIIINSDISKQIMDQKKEIESITERFKTVGEYEELTVNINRRLNQIEEHEQKIEKITDNFKINEKLYAKVERITEKLRTFEDQNVNIEYITGRLKSDSKDLMELKADTLKQVNEQEDKINSITEKLDTFKNQLMKCDGNSYISKNFKEHKEKIQNITEKLCKINEHECEINSHSAKLKQIEENIQKVDDILKKAQTPDLSLQRYNELNDKTELVGTTCSIAISKIESLSTKIKEIEKWKLKNLPVLVEELATDVENIKTNLAICMSPTKDEENKNTSEKLNEASSSETHVINSSSKTCEMRTCNIIQDSSNKVVGFHAKSEDSILFLLDKGDTVSCFHEVLLDPRNCFDSHTGIFTVPSDGLYLLSLRIDCGKNVSRFNKFTVFRREAQSHKECCVAETYKAENEAMATSIALSQLCIHDQIYIKASKYIPINGFAEFVCVLIK